ncbi:MAG: hypothetical protein E6H63_08070 [Betaproteobacteria bacterium]|nr:MAG: hypothetical protein E6H63_08070 [Betaproteobacteria bacterium]
MAAPAPELKTLGRYNIERTIGKGAMGVVYEGLDPRLGRRVAIKTILKSHLDEDTAKDYSMRFVREAQAVARLNHPNIVQVYDFGEEGDIAYLVMEFIKGKELKTFFDANERFDLKEAVRIMCELCDALEHHPPRHQARQRDARRAGAHQANRLRRRARAGLGQDFGGAHAGGNHGGNAGVHVARADHRRAARQAHRRVLCRHHPLSVPRRRKAVHRLGRLDHRQENHPGGAATALVAEQRRHAALRRSGEPGPRQEPRPALPVGARPLCGAEARARGQVCGGRFGQDGRRRADGRVRHPQTGAGGCQGTGAGFVAHLGHRHAGQQPGGRARVLARDQGRQRPGRLRALRTAVPERHLRGAREAQDRQAARCAARGIVGKGEGAGAQGARGGGAPRGRGQSEARGGEGTPRSGDGAQGSRVQEARGRGGGEASGSRGACQARGREGEAGGRCRACAARSGIQETRSRSRGKAAGRSEGARGNRRESAKRSRQESARGVRAARSRAQEARGGSGSGAGRQEAADQGGAGRGRRSARDRGRCPLLRRRH